MNPFLIEATDEFLDLLLLSHDQGGLGELATWTLLIVSGCFMWTDGVLP